MSEADVLADSFVALNEFFVGDLSLRETLTRIAALTVRAVPRTRFVGVSMLADGAIGTQAYTDPVVCDIDEVQYETLDGPCITAFRTGEPVSVRSTAQRHRFPAFAAVAFEHGVRSALALPLRTHRETVGVMNLYADIDDAYPPATVESVTEGYAKHAAFLIANARSYWDARDRFDAVRGAVENRAPIEQAKGIIIATTGCSPADAFRHLVARSHHEDIRLADLAIHLIAEAQEGPAAG